MVSIEVTYEQTSQDAIYYNITGYADPNTRVVYKLFAHDAHPYWVNVNYQYTDATGAYRFRHIFSFSQKDQRFTLVVAEVVSGINSVEVDLVPGEGVTAPLPPPPDPGPEPQPNGFPVPCLVRAIMIPAPGQIWLRKNVRARMPRSAVKGYYSLSKTLLQVF